LKGSVLKMADERNIQDEERPDVHLIPDNFMNDGKMFNGMIGTRNFFEAIGFGVGLGFIEYVFMSGVGLSTATIVAVILITAGPVAIAALIGINGDSLTQFIVIFLNYMKNKRKLRYRRIMKNAKTSGSRIKSRPTNKKKAPRTSGKK